MSTEPLNTDLEPGPPPVVPVPDYILDHDDPAALFTRLQRVVIHIELLQREAMRGSHELPVSRIAEYLLRPMGSISQAVDRVEKADYEETSR